ncbi:type IV secretory system conjugative DNA transfer family protein, partial [Klebsiella pneumoniae]
MKKQVCLLLSGLLLAGCAGQHHRPPAGMAGNLPPPDLRAWLTPTDNQDDGISDTRRQMLTDAGRTLGFRGGKAQRSWELIQALNARESTLNALYDFRPLISREGWLPPVIDEAQDVAHIQPDQIRTASRVWTILRPERFVSNPPGWRDWLLRGLSTTATPGTEGRVVPEDRAQRRLWENALRQGWQEGRDNADLTLEANQK